MVTRSCSPPVRVGGVSQSVTSRATNTNIAFSFCRISDPRTPAHSILGMGSVGWDVCDPEQGVGLYAGGDSHLLKLELISTPPEKC